MQAITSPRNGYCIPRVSYIAVTTGCDSTDGVDASASQHDVAVGDPPEGRAQMMAGRRRRARRVFLLGAVLVMTMGDWPDGSATRQSTPGGKPHFARCSCRWPVRGRWT